MKKNEPKSANTPDTPPDSHSDDAEAGAPIEYSPPLSSVNLDSTGNADLDAMLDHAPLPAVRNTEIEPFLLPQHLRKVEGLKRSIRLATGYVSILSAEELKAIGYGSKVYLACLPVLAFKIHNADGQLLYYSIRPDNPRERDGKIIKYENAPGTSLCLVVNPIIRDRLDDPACPLIITEGVIKADHAISHGLICIALLGVWCWRGTNSKGGKAALSDWELIALNGRKVHIGFDSDWQRKPQVAEALKRLVDFLRLKGATVYVIYLEDTPDGEKVGLDDFFLAGGTVEELFDLAEEVTDKAGLRTVSNGERFLTQAHRDSKESSAEDSRPVIETSDRDLLAVVTDLVPAIALFNSPPRLFHGSAGLTHISVNKEGVNVLRAVAVETLMGFSSEAALWVKCRNGSPARTFPPKLPIQVFLNRPDLWRNIPPIDTLAQYPFFDSDGQLCASPGYHEAARAWLQLAPGFQLPDTTPTSQNLLAARRLVLEKIFAGVAFADPASRAHAVAALLQPLVRSMIKGATPVYFFEAPLPGSGKSYAANLVILPYGTPASFSDIQDNVEWEKTVFTAFYEGFTHFFIDNVTGNLDSPALASFITEAVKTQRLLGINKIAAVNTRRATWLVTGNNASPSSDTVSRMAKSRLDTGLEVPASRAFDFKPDEFIKQHRAEVLGALITMVRGWLEAGRPEFTAITHRFHEWSGIMGGILEVNGIPGFLANLRDEQEIMSPDREVWVEFLAEWFAVYSSSFVTAKQLLNVFYMCDALQELVRTGDGTVKRLADHIRRQRDIPYGGLRIERAPKKTKQGVLWRVVPCTPPPGSASIATSVAPGASPSAPSLPSVPSAPSGTVPALITASDGGVPADDMSNPMEAVQEPTQTGMAKPISDTGDTGDGGSGRSEIDGNPPSEGKNDLARSEGGEVSPLSPSSPGRGHYPPGVDISDMDYEDLLSL